MTGVLSSFSISDGESKEPPVRCTGLQVPAVREGGEEGVCV